MTPPDAAARIMFTAMMAGIEWKGMGSYGLAENVNIYHL